MTGHTRGKAFLLKISDGSTPPIYRTIAGLRTISESIGDGVSIKASGIFLGSEAEGIARSRALDGMLEDYELSYEDGVKLHRRFLIRRLDYAGDFNGERNYTIQLESADGRNALAAIDPAAFVEAARGMMEAAQKAHDFLRGNREQGKACTDAEASLFLSLTAFRSQLGEGGQ